MFVLNTDGTLIAMEQRAFEKETDFQELLVRYPDLLSGELIDPESPRRWLLVAREMAIASEENGPGWLSVDHLFLDQDGIPTIVEVKRCSDPRLRREVIAQLLDYAANGLARWKWNDLKSKFESECLQQELAPAEVHGSAFGPGMDYDFFWTMVKTNLEAKQVRMLLVADVIPREVKAVVEFLNAQMNTAEFLALELRQYTGNNGLRTIVPTIFGMTEIARSAKGVTSGQVWTEDTVISEVDRRFGAAATDVARKILAWMKSHDAMVSCGSGKLDGSINAVFYSRSEKVRPLTIYSMGRVYVNAGFCLAGAFSPASKRLEWLRKMNEIEGVQLTLNEDKFPWISLDKLAIGDRLNKFLAVMDWFWGELNSEPTEGAPEANPTGA